MATREFLRVITRIKLEYLDHLRSLAKKLYKTSNH